MGLGLGLKEKRPSCSFGDDAVRIDAHVPNSVRSGSYDQDVALQCGAHAVTDDKAIRVQEDAGCCEDLGFHGLLGCGSRVWGVSGWSRESSMQP